MPGVPFCLVWGESPAFNRRSAPHSTHLGGKNRSQFRTRRRARKNRRNFPPAAWRQDSRGQGSCEAVEKCRENVGTAPCAVRKTSAKLGEKTGRPGDSFLPGRGPPRRKAHGCGSKPALFRTVTFSQPCGAGNVRTGPEKILSVTRIVSPPGAKVRACSALGPLVKTLPRTITLP